MYMKVKIRIQMNFITYKTCFEIGLKKRWIFLFLFKNPHMCKNLRGHIYIFSIHPPFFHLIVCNLLLVKLKLVQDGTIRRLEDDLKRCWWSWHKYHPYLTSRWWQWKMTSKRWQAVDDDILLKTIVGVIHNFYPIWLNFRWFEIGRVILTWWMITDKMTS